MAKETTTEKMSLTRALTQLKLLDKRLHKAKNKCFVTYKVGNQIHNQNCSAASNFNEYSDLLKRRRAIKNALVVANATTQVKIGSTTMTIAEAIELKNSIKYEIELKDALRNQLDQAANEIIYANTRAQERLDAQIEAMAGKSGKMRDEDYKSLSEVFWSSNKAVIVDEIDITKKIDELDEFIDEFMSEVDLVLSEINGRTDITIKY
jgi:hypothetical protein